MSRFQVTVVMEPDLDDLIGEAEDALKLSEELRDQLTDKSDLLDELSKLANALYGDLDTSQSVEVISDFYSNLKEANQKLSKLIKDLTTATVAARKEHDDAALDAIKEAKEIVKALKRELDNLEPES